jgi:hypothetical protein
MLAPQSHRAVAQTDLLADLPSDHACLKIVHRRGADRTPRCLALIRHREINNHPIEVVAQYFTSLQRHANSSILKGFDYDMSAGLA